MFFARFMRQVQDETLRLSTLAPWAARYSDKDVWVCGHRVPARTPIITALGVSLKNTQQWEEEEKWVLCSCYVECSKYVDLNVRGRLAFVMCVLCLLLGGTQTGLQLRVLTEREGTSFAHLASTVDASVQGISSPTLRWQCLLLFCCKG